MEHTHANYNISKAIQKKNPTAAYKFKSGAERYEKSSKTEGLETVHKGPTISTPFHKEWDVPEVRTITITVIIT